MTNKNCKFCGNSFLAEREKRVYCSRKCFSNDYTLSFKREKRKCIMCPTMFVVLESSTKKLCSVICANKFFSKKFVGCGNPNYSKRHPNMFKHTITEKLKIKKAVTNHWKTQDRMKKHMEAIERYKKVYGYYPMSSSEAREKISISSMNRVKNNKNYTWKKCRRGYYKSIKTNKNEYFQSSYEKNRMIELDNDFDIKNWTKRHGMVIKYDNARRYYPDFYIEKNNGEKILEEVKGYIKDTDTFIKKCKFAIDYCKNKNFIFVINFPNKKHKEMYKLLLDKIYES